MAVSEFDSVIKLLNAVINYETFFIELLNELDQEIVTYQQGQMLRGETNTGDLITPDYAPSTLREKRGRSDYKAPSGTPNLKDTGQFQDDIFAKIESRFINLGSTNEKTPELTAKYKNIFGWNEETKRSFIINVLRPATLQKLQRFNGLY